MCERENHSADAVTVPVMGRHCGPVRLVSVATPSRILACSVWL